MPTAWLPFLFRLSLFCIFVACYCVAMGAAAAPLQAGALVDVKCINIQSMAVVNGIMGGGLSGSVGKVTFRKGIKGETIASQKAEKVHNPNTEDQAYQRMCMNTAMKAYSAMKEICNHSFEGVPYGQKTMSAFIRENLFGIQNGFAGISQVLNQGFTAKGIAGGVAPRPFLISKGSIAPANIDSLSGGGVTWKQFKAKMNVKEGDQLTLVAFISPYNFASTVDYDEAAQIPFKFVYSRYLFKDTITDDLVIINGNQEYINNEALQEIEDPGDLNLVLAKGEMFSAGYNYVEVKYLASNWYVNGYAAIISRNVNGVWKRSLANILWNQVNKIYELGIYKTDSVLKTYNATPRKFLNNANV